MQYGDVVKYTRNGEKLNAMVVQAQMFPDGEHLTLVYLDPLKASPLMGGGQVQGAVATAFSVVPLKEGANSGWEPSSEQELEALVDAGRDKIRNLLQEIANLRGQIEGTSDPTPNAPIQSAEGGPVPEVPGVDHVE